MSFLVILMPLNVLKHVGQLFVKYDPVYEFAQPKQAQRLEIRYGRAFCEEGTSAKKRFQRFSIARKIDTPPPPPRRNKIIYWSKYASSHFVIKVFVINVKHNYNFMISKLSPVAKRGKHSYFNIRNLLTTKTVNARIYNKKINNTSEQYLLT